MSLPRVLRDLLTLPTAPFRETAVLAYVQRATARLPHVSLNTDLYGNLYAHYRHLPGRTKRRRATPAGAASSAPTPLVFTAHTDHPGFVALEMAGPRRLLAEFRGGVRPAYFPGARVRFWVDATGAGGEVGQVAAVSHLPHARRAYVDEGRCAMLVGKAGGKQPPPALHGARGAGIRGADARAARADWATVRAVVRRLRLTKKPEGRGFITPPNIVELDVPRPVPPGTIGMWDLPDPAERDGCVYARGCDDVAGVAALLALLMRLTKSDARAEVYCLFTRAEEVGFVGAIAAARAGLVPPLPIIAVECSSALPHAPLGAGPILRVGDRATTFTPGLTAFCGRVADGLSGGATSQARGGGRANAGLRAGQAAARRSFAYQRRLMDGGTCESTAYLAYGYAATGLCIALGNYHNMDVRRQRIAPEYVNLHDWANLVRWFEALALDTQGYPGEGGLYRERMEQRYATYAPLLTPGGAGASSGGVGVSAGGVGVSPARPRDQM